MARRPKECLDSLLPQQIGTTFRSPAVGGLLDDLQSKLEWITVNGNPHIPIRRKTTKEALDLVLEKARRDLPISYSDDTTTFNSEEAETLTDLPPARTSNKTPVSALASAQQCTADSTSDEVSRIHKNPDRRPTAENLDIIFSKFARNLELEESSFDDITSADDSKNVDNKSPKVDAKPRTFGNQEKLEQGINLTNGQRILKGESIKVSQSTKFSSTKGPKNPQTPTKTNLISEAGISKSLPSYNLQKQGQNLGYQNKPQVSANNQQSQSAISNAKKNVAVSNVHPTNDIKRMPTLEALNKIFSKVGTGRNLEPDSTSAEVDDSAPLTDDPTENLTLVEENLRKSANQQRLEQLQQISRQQSTLTGQEKKTPERKPRETEAIKEQSKKSPLKLGSPSRGQNLGDLQVSERAKDSDYLSTSGNQIHSKHLEGSRGIGSKLDGYANGDNYNTSLAANSYSAVGNKGGNNDQAVHLDGQFEGQHRNIDLMPDARGEDYYNQLYIPQKSGISAQPTSGPKPFTRIFPLKGHLNNTTGQSDQDSYVQYMPEQQKENNYFADHSQCDIENLIDTPTMSDLLSEDNYLTAYESTVTESSSSSYY